jgi:fatty acid desaturase
MAMPVSVIAHNHNHLNIWTVDVLNCLTDYWLTMFYGFPVFGWIPTHNQNHHKMNNRPGDYTATWRYTEANHIFMLLAYPSVSGYHQQKPIREYLINAWKSNKPRFYYCTSQIVVLVAFIAVGLLLDWYKTLIYIVCQQQVATFTVLVFNFLQHVHADEESEWNHSRNFTGPILNGLLFNNGFHTVHHWKSTVHWSETPALHYTVEKKIDPKLNEPCLARYLLRTYILAPFVPSLRVASMRLERIAKQSGLAGTEKLVPAKSQ